MKTCTESLLKKVNGEYGDIFSKTKLGEVAIINNNFGKFIVYPVMRKLTKKQSIKFNKVVEEYRKNNE